jgi:uncharacterized membrane protein YjgN (DUF898 family)
MKKLSSLNSFRIFYGSCLALYLLILTLGLAQPITEMSRRFFLGVKGGWLAHKADNLTAIRELIA